MTESKASTIEALKNAIKENELLMNAAKSEYSYRSSKGDIMRKCLKKCENGLWLAAADEFEYKLKLLNKRHGK